MGPIASLGVSGTRISEETYSHFCLSADLHMVGMFWSNDFSWSYGSLVKSYIKSCQGGFSATNDQISLKFHGNLHYEE